MSETNLNDSEIWITFVGHASGAWSFAADEEEGELEEELIDREDWDALAALRRKQNEDCPCPLCSAGLAEALVAGARYEEALEVLRPAEEEVPGDPLLTELILNALHCLGRELDDFPWAATPRVVLLADGALEMCHEHLLRTGRKPTVGALRQEVFADTYLDFTSEQLADAMQRDGRFVVETDERGRWKVGLR